jgi:hypothetical protein
LVSHDEICLSHVAMTIYAYWEVSYLWSFHYCHQTSFYPL